ncbi:hypothetical protein L345_06406, partial [Ophiophagus hannah]
HYISVDTSRGTSGDTAVLLSPELYTGEWSCIRLIYQIASASELPLGSITLNLYIRVEGESLDHLLWTTTEHSESWLIASVDVKNRTDKFKFVLEGVLGTETFASIAIFEIKISNGYCIECDFEENHLCGFMNRWNPNVNWFVGGGNIGNSQSILPKDHTFRNEFGHYMYVDSLYVKHFQEVAQLVSPKTLTPMSGCLSFYYQVQQESGIVFTIYTRDVNGFYEELWKADRPTNYKDGSGWSRIKVKPNAYRPGDHTTGTDIPPDFPGECTFEKNECAFTLQPRNRHGWHRRRSPTPTSYTGPIGDHTTGVGHYMYIEASNMIYGQKAQLISRLLRKTFGHQCLIFFYHMYGRGTGLLNVYLKMHGSKKEILIWRRRGEQSISWLRGLIEYTCDKSHQIIFEAIRGISVRSDIAIDDISFQRGPCK